MLRNQNLNFHPLTEITYKIHGRTDEDRQPLPLFWCGSGIEVNVTGSELWIDIEADYEQYEPWAACILNGAFISRQMLPPGRQRLCLFRGMNESSVKNVRFLRELQAMSEDNDNCLLVHGFSTDGFFLPLSNPRFRLEFIGDSITSGEGTYGSRAEDDWIPMFMSASNNYAHMVSQTLDADYRLISQGGWGVLSSWDNNPYHNIPSCYEKICGLLQGEKNEALGAFKPYRFHTWEPDAIIINLGTNDAGAFEQPAWQDPVSGRQFKQRLNPDGSYHPSDIARFEQAVTDFLLMIRKNNPRSHIVWCYGMVSYALTLPITNAINTYRKQTGDLKVSFLQLPASTEETVGSRCHPGVLSHQMAAQLLTDYLKIILEA